MFLMVLVLIQTLPIGIAAQEQEEKPADLSEGRLFGIGGQVLVPTLTTAYISGRLWTSDNFGLEGDAGTISIPGVATFPSFMGRALLKFINQPTVDFYIAGGASIVLFGGGPILLPVFGGSATSFIAALGAEFSTAKNMAFSAEAGIAIGGGGFAVLAGGSLHFYL